MQRWGRRIPPIMLAAGAVVVVAASLAGTAIVASSLLGLREDHGQWVTGSVLRVTSMLAGVPGLVAWLVLTGAAARAARAAGLPAPRSPP